MNNRFLNENELDKILEEYSQDLELEELVDIPTETLEEYLMRKDIELPSEEDKFIKIKSDTG